MTSNVAPKAIAREQGLPTEEGVTGPLEVHRLRHRHDGKPPASRPSLEIRGLPLADAETKPRREKPLPENKARIGSEDKVGQARLRLEQIDRRPQLDQRLV